MLAKNRVCPECGGCRCRSECCPNSEACQCPSGVRHVPAFGSVAAGDSRFMNRDDAHDADEDAQPEHPATLAAQVGALMPYMQTAERDVTNGAERLTAIRHDRTGALLTLAGQRLVTGHAEHGSSLFTMSDAELAQNLAEEYADALVYRAEQLRREALREAGA